MFGKLLKNDFIQTGRLFMWLLIIGVAGGGIGALVTMKQGIGAGQFALAAFWNLLLVMGAYLLIVLGLVFILVTTNRSLFSERGYLTFSLPVSTTQMLLSKFVTNVVFMLLTIAEVAGLFYVALSNFRRLFSNIGDALLEQVGEAGGMPEGLDIGEMFSQMGFSLGLPSFASVLQFVGFVLAVILAFLVLAMMIALFVLTISHVRPFQSATWLWILAFSVGTGVVSGLLDKWISSGFQIGGWAFPGLRLIVPLRFSGLLEGEGISLNLTHAIVWLGISAVLFIVTDYLMSRKISLK